MFTINGQGVLEEQSFTHQTLNWGDRYRFHHARWGIVIATLIAEDQEWYFVELAHELETPATVFTAGERYPLRKSMVRSVDVV